MNNDKISITVNTPKQHASKPAETVLEKCIIVLLGTLGSIGTFMSYLSYIEYSAPLMIVFSIAVTCLFVVSFSLKKNIAPVIISEGLLVAAYIIFNGNRILDGIIMMIDAFKKSAADSGYTVYIRSFETTNSYETAECVNSLIMALILLVAFLCSYQIVRRRTIPAGIILVLVFTLEGIFVDLQPNLIYFAMSTAFCMAAIILILHKNEPESHALRKTMIIAGTVIAASLCVMLLCPSKLYKRTEFMNNLKNKAEGKFYSAFHFVDRKLKEATGSGGFAHGELDSVEGKVSFDNKTDIIVEVPNTGKTMYIKSYTAKDYNNGKWDNDDLQYFPYDTYNPDFFGGYAYKLAKEHPMAAELQLGIESTKFSSFIWQCRVKITKKDDVKDETFIPYGTLNENNEEIYLPTITRIDDDSYYLRYYLASESARLKDVDNFGKIEDVGRDIEPDYKTFYDNENYYKKYIEDMYMNVPRFIDYYVIKEFGKVEIHSNKDIEYFIRRVQANFEKSYTYTLEPKRINYEKDILEDFLTESKSGYCMHFATAATLIFRSVGIPARYAEGYIVTKQDIEEGTPIGFVYDDEGNVVTDMVRVEVSDKRAHAWVEIYKDGYGWVPVEVTVGYGDSGESAQIIRPTETSAPKPSTEPTTAKPTTTPSTKADTTKSSQDGSTGATEHMSKLSSDRNNNNKISFNYTALTVIVLVLLVIITPVLAVCIRHMTVIKRAKEVFDENNTVYTHKRTMAVYRYFDRLLYYLDIDKTPSMSYIEYKSYIKERCRYADVVDTDSVMDAVIECAFGNPDKLMDRDTVKKAADNVLKLSKCIYEDLKGTEKFMFKYIINLYYF